MQYLIQFPGSPPFFTNYFDPANHYIKGLFVVDLINKKYFDGISWVEIDKDHL